jgi:hypothetical protein
MKYTIECDGILYGPFATDREAADWALNYAALASSIDTCHSAAARAMGED